MPCPYPKEFREDVVPVARGRESGVIVKQIATDFGISEATLQNWLRQADIEDGNRPGQTVSVTGEPETRWLPEMTCPLVAQLVDAGIGPHLRSPLPRHPLA